MGLVVRLGLEWVRYCGWMLLGVWVGVLFGQSYSIAAAGLVGSMVYCLVGIAWEVDFSL